jgi:hypothetical protein
MIDPQHARSFLSCGRIALVGASDDPKSFGGTVRRSLVDHGVDVVAGACPLMFVEPVRGAHRLHLAIRRLKHSVAKAA